MVGYDATRCLVRAGAHVDGAGIESTIDLSHYELPERSFATNGINGLYLGERGFNRVQKLMHV